MFIQQEITQRLFGSVLLYLQCPTEKQKEQRQFKVKLKWTLSGERRSHVLMDGRGIKRLV